MVNATAEKKDVVTKWEFAKRELAEAKKKVLDVRHVLADVDEKRGVWSPTQEVIDKLDECIARCSKKE